VKEVGADGASHGEIEGGEAAMEGVAGVEVGLDEEGGFVGWDGVFFFELDGRRRGHFLAGIGIVADVGVGGVIAIAIGR